MFSSIIFSNISWKFQVVRLCAKSREAVSSPVEHLTLHYQVNLFVLPDYSCFMLHFDGLKV